MKKLVYYTPHKLYSYRNIAAIDHTQVSFAQMFNSCISIIDRSNSITCPAISIENLYPLPQWTSTDSFETLCINRFNDLMQTAIASNKTLVLFYSGGIDSTLLVVLALMHPDFKKYKDNIKLVFSEDSITENPVFWEQFILPSFKTRIANSSGFQSYMVDAANMCITGEFADNIFGSLSLKNYIDVTGDNNAIHKPFNDTGRKWLLAKVLQSGNRANASDKLDAVLSTSPRPLESNHDCFWWLNFILKWQAVNYRLVSHTPNPSDINNMIENTIHFFDTELFQNWAVSTSEDKVKNDWYSYKFPAKQMIFNFNKDHYYFKWKTKYPSIPSLTRYANMYDFIYVDSKTGKYSVSKTLDDNDNFNTSG